ncbi:macrolide family glycosyltransferase [Saccharothrix yanglingensis]|uniref:Oleandomycin glycosyltransferase n=1 Tax=Saccharothrix yanglingensis TaxID=659496 RepID=A0ABU0X990_9PSEU|nr:macrolide family glycosyltransferase [Saccharothrix yanglingensis]MDQ2588705.1 oleandomycin glycosyltransferase [Saccharothrix yanglingensis]
MAHIAFFSIPAHGHMRPPLAVAAELVRRGHRVSFAATAGFADAVTAAGAGVVPYETRMAEWLGPGRAANSDQDADALAWSTVLFFVESAHLTARAEGAFAGDRPDLVVHDMSLAPLGRALEHAWGCPAVQSTPSMASNRYYSQLDALLKAGGVRRGHPALVERRRLAAAFIAERGLPETPEALVGWAAKRALVYVPRVFQIAADTFDEHTAFVGTCLGDDDLAGRWEPPDERPVVLVSMGTTVNSDPGFFRGCAAAFADSPWHVVLALGGGVTPESLGGLPANVEAHAWVPQMAVLGRASAFVTAGGLNSLMMALLAGVPVVAVPHMSEALLLSRRTAALGLGTVLAAGEATGPRLRSAVTALLADGAASTAAGAVRDLARAAGGTRAAADALEGHLPTTVRSGH